MRGGGLVQQWHSDPGGPALPRPLGLRPPRPGSACAGGRGRRSSPACRPRPRCSAEGRPRCWRRSPRRSRHRRCCPPSRRRPPSRRPRRPRRPGPCNGGRGSPPAGLSSTWKTTWSCRRCRWASGPVASWPARAAPAGAATREWRPPTVAARWSARHVQRQEERRGRQAGHAGIGPRSLPPGGRKPIRPPPRPTLAPGRGRHPEAPGGGSGRGRAWEKSLAEARRRLPAVGGAPPRWPAA